MEEQPKMSPKERRNGSCAVVTGTRGGHILRCGGPLYAYGDGRRCEYCAAISA